MDWVSILSAVAASGVVTSIISIFTNKRINNATAGNVEADYTSKILEQTEQRVKHAIDDRERALLERDEAYAESKEQRKAKREWRDKYLAFEKEYHKLELRIRDTEAKVQEAEWHRCEVNGCKDRMPPRKRKEE